MSTETSNMPVSDNAQSIVAASNEAAEAAVTAPAAVSAPAPAPAKISRSKRRRNNKKRKAAINAQTQPAPAAPATEKPKSKTNHKRSHVLVESGQVLDGRVAGFALGADKQTRVGVVLRFKGGDSAFMHVTQMGSHAPQDRLNRMLLGDTVQVTVTVKSGEGKRSVKASEKSLYHEGILKELEGGLVGITGEVIRKVSGGALLKLTTPGVAYGLVGMLLSKSVPGGARALDSVKVGKSMEVDITRVRVDEEKNVLRLSLNAFTAHRRELENRFPVGISINGNVVSDAGDSFLLRLKSGEPCKLSKSNLNGTHPDALKVGRSTNGFVTGVDAHGVILLSKVMPE
jgi:ribosomal protein S1